ncbi:hypothetical protein C8A00DRAFT_11028 [Chaetomidium leptoderma]|uniref:Uncharacterized protein n=1 Tax=Chaetomidium leptoderma TaxID=669021 RepID=A0AAN6VX55_9PEZI|nr:hypothetical protein C8A00DRAFT_11028 [Chaetomidium leptoderma]
MEALRSHPPGTTSRRRHDHKRSPEYRRQDIQTKHRKRSLQTSARHLAETSLPIGDLGDGPVPRSKEKNDEFIQCWLQQTQPRPSHIPEPDRESGRPRLAEQSRSRAHADKHRKRPRSPSEHPRPSLNAAGQVEEYRFEKRARHKTRDDKYDYKARAGNKRASGEELRKRRTKNASGRSDEVGEDRYSVGQLEANAPRGAQPADRTILDAPGRHRGGREPYASKGYEAPSQ